MLEYIFHSCTNIHCIITSAGFQGVTTTILECGALVVLTLEVAPQLPGYLLLPLLNVLLMTQILIEPWKPKVRLDVTIY
jgi:hypothetical protein